MTGHWQTQLFVRRSSAFWWSEPHKEKEICVIAAVGAVAFTGFRVDHCSAPTIIASSLPVLLQLHVA